MTEGVLIEYELTPGADGSCRYDIVRGPEILNSGYRPSKGAAAEAAREDMKLARLFF